MAERQVAGLDTLDAGEAALLDAMRNETPEREPQAAPDPAPVAADEPDDLDDAPEAEVQTDGEKKVSLKALQEERKRRQAEVERARKAEQALEVEKARFAERLTLLTQAVSAAAPQPAAAPAAEIPSIETDPIGHFKAVAEAQNKRLAEQQAILDGFQQRQQQAQAAAELRNWGTAQEREFMAREPSYAEAMDFLKASRHAELEHIGVADPAQRDQMIMQDITNIAVASKQNDANFAERLFNVAKSRGFAAKTAAPAIPPLDATPALDAAARVERGRQSSTTIGTAGAAPAPTLTPERIANMPEHEFAAYLKKIEGNPTALRQLMGA